MAAHPLKSYKVLLVDPDIELAKVLASMLSEMGFVNCQITHSGKDAYGILKDEPYDFLITEWRLNDMDGIELLKKIRRAPDSPNPTLPAIMLTGRAEQPDVFAARDFGINEFVVKPFSAKTIYSRIERIIENPRQFVVSPGFVGPSRRMRGTPPARMGERRVRKIQPQLQPQDILGAMRAASVPRIWLPDFTLKYKLGKNVTLDSLITPAVLDQAQAAVDAIAGSSLDWIKTNLQNIRQLLYIIEQGDHRESLGQDIGEVALIINSRAGTFGYSRASEIAYQLYLFCRNRVRPDNANHYMVIRKHVDVLQVILGNQMRGSAGALGDQLAPELQKLVAKFS
jgi:two-component system chemotaxis response regulator CheY